MKLRGASLAPPLGASLLVACALLPSAPPPALPLLPPAALGGARAASQVLSFAYREREFTLQGALQATPKEVRLVALGPLGSRAFTLSYDGTQVQTEAGAGLPKDLPPERVLADVELALWPLAAWQARLKDTEWGVSEPRPHLRRLRYRGVLVEEVHYANEDSWNGRLWLVNLALGYSLDVETHAQ